MFKQKKQKKTKKKLLEETKDKILSKYSNLKNRYAYKIFIIVILGLLLFSLNNTIIKKNINGRIFVTFMYNNEAETAYIHIWRLYNYVYKFIIVVSNKTISGLPKNISFSPFEKELRPYMKKVDIIYFNQICNKREYPSDNHIWCFEKSQRDYAKTYIEEHYAPTEDDLFIVGDIDEIMTREGIQYVIKNPPKHFYHVKGSLYFPYYYHKVTDWNKGYVIRYKKNMKTLSKYRDMYPNEFLKFDYNAKRPLITHCSYCFKKLEQYKNKIISFPHQEFNKEPYITNNWIFKSHYCRKKINSRQGQGYDEPYEGWRHLIPDDERLKYIIDPSFMYPLNLTNYTEKDLETLCNRKYRRTPFE